MSTPPSDHQPYPGHEKRWIALFAILLAQFMSLLDVTIVNVALPTLQKDMGATASDIEWVVAGFILIFALGLLPLGRLGDIIGKKKMFIGGVAFFTVSSILCGIAPNIEFLIAARFLQGAAGAVMVPQVLSIAQTIFPPHERSAAFSLFGLTAGLATVTGPLVGGVLIGADIYELAWRPIFLINVPIGLVAIVLGMRVIPSLKGDASLKIDFGGIAIVSIAMFLMIFPLIEGRNYEWAAWCFWMIGASLVFFVLFILWEGRQKKRGAAALLPIDLMKNRNFAIGTFMSIAFFSAMPSFFLIFALYLQSGYGLTPLWSGLTTMPFSVGIVVASIISGRLGFRWQKQRITTGLFLLFCGIFFVRYTAISIGEEMHYGIFVAPLVVAGIGLGIAISSLFQTILAGVPVKDAGSGSGALQALQQAGGALGVAIVSEIFFSSLNAEFASGATPPEAFREALTASTIYNLVAYVFVIVCVFLLKNPSRTGYGQPPQPAPVIE